jgi:ribosomal protein S8
VEKINQLIEFIKTYRTGDAIKTEYAKWITKSIVNDSRAFSAATKEASELLKILCDEGYISKQETVGGGMSVHMITSYSLLPDKAPELKAYLSRLRKNN